MHYLNLNGPCCEASDLCDGLPSRSLARFTLVRTLLLINLGN